MAKMKSATGKIDMRVVAYVVGCFAFSCVFSWVAQPWYHGNDNAITVLATVISILAGFLIAVMAIVADERSLRGKNWRQDTYYLLEIKNQLARHRLMFHLYMWSLLLIFLASLNGAWPPKMQFCTDWIALVISTFSLLLSFRLPGELTARQNDFLGKLISSKRDSQAGTDE